MICRCDDLANEPHARRGMCNPCYKRWYRRDKVPTYNRQVEGWLALEEFEWLRPRGVPINQACKIVAPELGMNWQALEKAYYRAKRKAQNDQVAS